MTQEETNKKLMRVLDVLFKQELLRVKIKCYIARPKRLTKVRMIGFLIGLCITDMFNWFKKKEQEKPKEEGYTKEYVNEIWTVEYESPGKYPEWKVFLKENEFHSEKEASEYAEEMREFTGYRFRVVKN